MTKPIPYDDDEPEQDERDMRKIVLYDDEALKLMQGWTGGQDDPLYAISSTGGWNYAWVFEAAIANLDRDLSRVQKIGRNKYQLGKGEFTKKEIDELGQIRDALQYALEDPESVLVDEGGVVRAPGLVRAVVQQTAKAADRELVGPGTDGLYKYHGASIEVSGWPGHYRATVRFRGQQYDFTSLTQDGVLKLAQQQIDEIADAGGVRAPRGHHVADFNTLDDLIAHAREEGATHLVSLLVRGTGKGETKLYFPRGDGAYDEANVRLAGGYWHAEGPGARKRVAQLPGNAVPIEQYGGGRGGRRSFGWAEKGRAVRDYEAIDRRDRVIAGPFKSYGDAKSAAGSAGAVRFVPSKKRATEAREPSRSAHHPTTRRR